MSKKLKVLIVPKWYPRENKPVSGIFVHEFAKAISRYCDVAILFGHQNSSIKKLYEIHYKKMDNIKVFYVYHKKILSSYICYMIAMFLAFRKIKKKFYPDIIHVHVYTAGILPLLLKHLYKIPYILTEHFKIIKPQDKFFIKKLKILLAKLIFRNAELLIHVSRFMADYIENFGIKNKYTIVPNTIDTSIFYYKNYNKNTYSKKKKHIIFVGNLTSGKGMDYLLHAISILKEKRSDFILNIVGDGEECSKYKDMVKKLNISDIVIFHGIKSKEEVAKMMRKSHFLVLPSLFETFSCVSIEAMATGLPVVATEVGAIKEIIDKNKGILIAPGDVNSLISAIEFMLDNHSKYDHSRISNYIRTKYGYDAVGKKLYDIYKMILNKQ